MTPDHRVCTQIRAGGTIRILESTPLPLGHHPAAHLRPHRRPNRDDGGAEGQAPQVVVVGRGEADQAPLAGEGVRVGRAAAVGREVRVGPVAQAEVLDPLQSM